MSVLSSWLSGANGRERPGPRIALLGGCFLLSGAASLIDQVVWLRYMSLIFGNTIWAAATLLAVFMGGLGAGALLAGRWGRRLSRPLTAYALCEVGVALLALASPQMLSWIDRVYVLAYRSLGNEPWLFAAGRVLLAAAFLFPPTLLMGATLPFVLAGAAPAAGAAGRVTALLYGINTLGAVAGTALAGFVTVPVLGLRASLLVAAAFNLVAALLALRLSRERVIVAAAPAARGRRALLALFFGMGATSLAYEVLWTRILVFYLGSSVYAYSVMLLLVLLGIAAGSLLAASWADRVGSLTAALALVELGIAAWVPVQVALFGDLNGILQAAVDALRPEGFGGVAVCELIAVLPLLLPQTLLMGMSFPLAVRTIHCEAAPLGAAAGGVFGFAGGRLRAHPAAGHPARPGDRRHRQLSPRPAARRRAARAAMARRPAAGCAVGRGRGGAAQSRHPRRRYVPRRSPGRSLVLPRGRAGRGHHPAAAVTGRQLPLARAQRRQRRRHQYRSLRRAEASGAPAHAARGRAAVGGAHRLRQRRHRLGGVDAPGRGRASR